jgi:regulator of RNase E activity RraA
MSSNHVARLRALDVCDLSDALDALGLPPAVTGLAPTGGARPVAGRAVTVKLAAGRAPTGAGRHLCTAAVEMAGPDDVIVVEQRSGIDAAGWGGILSCAAKTRGIAGTLVDGPTRDVPEAVRHDYAVYARGVTARTARGRIHEAECQTAIRLGDTTVATGDYIAADTSGCVVIPADEIEAVLAKAEAIRDKGEAMTAAVKAGRPVSEVMSRDYETMLERRSS